MNAFAWTGSILALLTYFPLWAQIKRKSVKQNLLTWALWAVLDIIVMASIIVQKGNFLLPVAYTIGSTVTVFVIFKSGDKSSWSWFETLITTLVIICVAVWYTSGSKAATVASAMAMVVASVPQIIDAWKNPLDMPVLVYFSCFIANCLSIAGGKNWSIEERFYPVVVTIICFVIFVISARKFWLKPVPTTT
jgi:hypothetical protein